MNFTLSIVVSDGKPELVTDGQVSVGAALEVLDWARREILGLSLTPSPTVEGAEK